MRFSLDSPLEGWRGGLIRWISGLRGLSFALLLLLVSCGTAGYGKELTLGKPEQKPCLALQGSASSMQIIGSGLWVQGDFSLCRNSVCFCSSLGDLRCTLGRENPGPNKLGRSQFAWKGISSSVQSFRIPRLSSTKSRGCGGESWSFALGKGCTEAFGTSWIFFSTEAFVPDVLPW